MSFDFVRARWATALVFVANGAMVGSWATQVPVAKARLDLTDTSLGLALLMMAIGAVLSMPFTGPLVSRFSSAGVTRWSIIGQLILLPGLAAAPDYVSFLGVCFVFGITNGLCDVAMNAHAIEVEKGIEKPIMSGLHGMWSIGGFAGSAIAAVLLPVVSPIMHFIIVCAVLALVMVWALTHLLPKGADTAHEGAHFSLPTKPLLLIGILTFFVMMSEGAMNDWSAVFMKTFYQANESLAAATYAAFAAGMSTGRLAGDFIRARLGTVMVLRVGGALATVALLAGTFGGAPAITIIAFGFAGLGLSNLVPLLYVAAGQTPGQSPAAAVAACATTGYMGFLVGPPLIGFISDHVGMKIAFILVALGCAMVMASARRASHSA